MRDQKITTSIDLGASVRRRRGELELTQSQLADVARVTPRLVGELEHGKPTAQFEGVMRILEALGLDVYLRAR
jgi:y4mF family transcriptional regulator